MKRSLEHRQTRENTLALALLVTVLIFNAIGLWPELSISRVDLNDNVFHFTLIERMVQAVESGQNPLDCWSPEWSLGYPVLRTYQPLAHVLVALVYLALGKSVGLMTVFVWARFLSVVLLPLSFFASARLMGLAPLTAAASAILAPLVSTNFLYGVEYGSYTWAGSGLFPQAVASHFFLLAMGLAFGAVRRGWRLALTGALLGLTFLAHLIYGYMGAISVCLLAVLPDAEVARWVRIRRVAMVGAVALLLAAFQLVPLLIDHSNINHSRWEAVWKWDSFGAGQVLKWLFTGELLDHGRLPVLTLLAFAGAALFFWYGRKGAPGMAATPGAPVSTASPGAPVTTAKRAARAADIYAADLSAAGLYAADLRAAHLFVLCGAALWTLMFFGRPFWGPLLVMLGVSADMQLHRILGGAQIFLVLLGAFALAAMWRELSRRWHVGFAAAATLLLLYPMVRERARNLANDATWGRTNLANYAAERQAIDAAVATARDRGGRAYAGLAASWGGRFKVGEVPFYAFFSEARVPAVSFLYHSMSLTSDIMVRFSELNPGHYRLFNIRTVVAPAGPEPIVPPFLPPLGEIGRFRLFEAPGESYFDVVDVVASVKTTRNNFYDVNDRWLQSDWVRKRAHLWLDWNRDAPPKLPRLAPDDPLPQMQPLPAPGEAQDEMGAAPRPDSSSAPRPDSNNAPRPDSNNAPDTYQAELDAARPSYALFKMTWHANWKAYLDGKPQKTVMLSPGFVGVPITAGHHRIVCRYEPEHWKGALGLAGLAGVLLLIVVEWRGLSWGWWSNLLAAQPVPSRRFLIAGGLVLLALPVCIPLFTGSVLAGHDGFVYFPRMVEVHENITHGIVVPRWAPDLGRGTGQPLFLFNPPMNYYFAEFWRLLGFDFVTAVNLGCVLVVLASAVSMFLLGRLYFGDAGGWLAAAAYLYAPYFAVDLYVRSAIGEFVAFPFFALTLYGFGAYARHGTRRHWLLGVAAYAGVMLCHFPAALLFTPLLLAFLGLTAWMEKSWALLLHNMMGFLLGIGMSAFIWYPALDLRQYASLTRLMTGYLRYSEHFVYLHQLFYSPWGYGLSLPGPNDGMSFALGWSHVLLAVLVWVWVSRGALGKSEPGVRRLMQFFGFAAIILCILMLQDAAWFWDQVPLLQNVEFPWRLLGPVALCLALLVALLGRLLASISRCRAAAMAAAMALLIVPNLSHLHPKQLVDVDLGFWTPQQLAVRGFETTTLGEATPRWIAQNTPPGLPPYTPAAATVRSGQAEIASPRRTPFFWSSGIDAKLASTIEMSTASFPGWKVTIDGQPVSAGPGSAGPGRPGGLITFQVPPGVHSVQVRYGRTPAEWAAAWISVAALALVLALGVMLPAVAVARK